jgi:hypothetical protein
MHPYSILDRYWTYLPGQQVVFDNWSTEVVTKVQGTDIFLQKKGKVSVERVRPDYSHKVTLKSGLLDAFRAWVSAVGIEQFRLFISERGFDVQGAKARGTLEEALLHDLTCLVSARCAWLPTLGLYPLMQKLQVSPDLFFGNSGVTPVSLDQQHHDHLAEIEMSLEDMTRKVRWVEYLFMELPIQNHKGRVTEFLESLL